MPPKHLLFEPHHPQPVAPEQSSQRVKLSQLPHMFEAPNCHSSGQVPEDGPEVVPALHVFELGHHPQPLVAAHD